MKLQQVSEHCFAVLNERGRLCDSNSGFVDRGGGLVIDTQSDLWHACRMVELFGGIGHGPARRVINTNESGEHVWGNQIFADAEIIAHRTVPARMKQLADPMQYQALIDGTDGPLSCTTPGATHPGARAAGRQLREDYRFSGIDPISPATLFDERLVLHLDGLEVHLMHVGPCHWVGDTIVQVPAEGVVFAGDVVFRHCTPMGWCGSCANWLRALDLVVWLDPEVIVPGSGPLCGIEGAMDIKAYLEYVRDECRRHFEQGHSALDAATQIDLGPYREWRSPARLIANVESAYRELRDEFAGTPWDPGQTFDSMYELAIARGMEVEF